MAPPPVQNLKSYTLRETVRNSAPAELGTRSTAFQPATVTPSALLLLGAGAVLRGKQLETRSMDSGHSPTNDLVAEAVVAGVALIGGLPLTA